MITVKNSYFKTSPGLMSGLDLNQYHLQEVFFSKCDFHPCCEDLVRKNLTNWTFDDCDVPFYIKGLQTF